MRRLILGLLGLVLCLSILGFMPVQAANPVDLLPNQICNDTNDRGELPKVCEDKQTTTTDEDSPITGNNGILNKIMNILAVVVGIACVLIIIISGLRFVVSAGDSNAISSARRSLLYAVVGLVIVILARTLVRFVLSKL